MATKLQIYNKALQLLGETRLASTSEDVPQRHELDVAWDTCVLDTFSAAFWNFATETESLSASGSPISGYATRFTRPSDCLRIIQVSLDARFSAEADYRDEGGYIYAQGDPIYVRLVSSTLAVDGSVDGWPPYFVEVLAARLAAECAYKITGGAARQTEMWALYERRLVEMAGRDEGNQHRQHRAPTGGVMLQTQAAESQRAA